MRQAPGTQPAQPGDVSYMSDEARGEVPSAAGKAADRVRGAARGVGAERARAGNAADRVRVGWRGTAGGAGLGLVLGALALGPGLGRGFLLSYDMVFVPRESLAAATGAGGPPRAVPSDLVVTLAEQVLPGDIVQKLILLLIFALACGGVVAALEGYPLLARLAAGVAYTWNPYVAERLVIGQWALLLGYAGLPWVLIAARRPEFSAWRLALAMLPAVIGGFAAMAITAPLLVPVTAARKMLAPVALLAAGCLPWLIPALLHPVYADPRGIAAFAARPDTPFGSVGSLLMLGGIWNAQVVPLGYGGGWSALWLAIVIAGLVGYIFLARPARRWTGLGAAAVAGLVIASAGVSAPGRDLLRAAAQAWPAVAIARDGQQFVAPLALAVALGLGVTVSWAMYPRPVHGGRHTKPGPVDAAGVLYGAFALIAPLVLLPGLLWGAAGRLRPAEYPAGWANLAETIDTTPGSGAVLLLPWTADRRPAWNGGRALLDPWPRLLSRHVIWNDGTTVGQLSMTPDDPDARALNAVIDGSGPMTESLRRAGIEFVLVDAGPSMTSRLPGCRVVANQDGIDAYQVLK
jgi:hypothetical protein